MAFNRQPLPPWQNPLIAATGTAIKEFYFWLKYIDNFLAGGMPNVQTANYTLLLADAGGIVEMNMAGANTVTVPPASTVVFPLGRFALMRITQIGAGQTTLVAGAGVTIHTISGLKVSGRYGVVSLYRRDNDEWVASGDLTA